LFQRNLFAKNNNVIKDALNNGSINNPVPLSDFYLEDASFFRFNNLTVGYNYSGKVLPFIKTFRAYVTLQNLAVLTAYKGFDPEVSNINSNAQGVPSVNMDYLTYPKPFTFTFGLNLGL
jgi:iron complex outermembrane receptor protein